MAFLALALVAALPARGHAFWSPDAALNVPVSLAPGEKVDVFVVPDGAGGIIAAWEDERDGHADIYAQRIDVNGTALWQADGVPVCSAPGDQELYHLSTGTTGVTPIIPDGNGGAYPVWQDGRFFAQRQSEVDVDGMRAARKVLLLD